MPADHRRVSLDRALGASGTARKSAVDILSDAAANASSLLAGDVVLKARSVSTEQFQSEILKAPSIFKPYVCLILIPGIVHMDLVATTTTDECGEFSTIFLRDCNNPDQPRSLLHLQMNFSPQLRANNIMLYQARIRKGSSGSFQPLTSTISRY